MKALWVVVEVGIEVFFICAAIAAMRGYIKSIENNRMLQYLLRHQGESSSPKKIEDIVSGNKS